MFSVSQARVTASNSPLLHQAWRRRGRGHLIHPWSSVYHGAGKGRKALLRILVPYSNLLPPLSDQVFWRNWTAGRAGGLAMDTKARTFFTSACNGAISERARQRQEVWLNAPGMSADWGRERGGRRGVTV